MTIDEICSACINAIRAEGYNESTINTMFLGIIKIPIFAVSTFNTDYILVKDADFEKSLAALLNAGYTVI